MQTCVPTLQHRCPGGASLLPPPCHPPTHIPLPPACAVAAGIPQRMLLDYLAEYRHCTQAAGWTLPAFTWWTDQVGGRRLLWRGVEAWCAAATQ